MTVDDWIEVYADGIKVAEDNGKWETTQVVTFPITTKVIAIKGINLYPGSPYGIIGSFSNGLVTNDMWWRCSNTLVPGWNTADLDDSSWAKAVVLARTDEPMGPKVAKAAEWIWTDNDDDNTVYCRASLGMS